MNSPKTLLGVAAALLLASGVLSVMNGAKVKTIRAQAQTAVAQQEATERQRAALEKSIKNREKSVSAQASKVTENEGRIAGAEAELVKTQTEKSDLLAKLQANEAQISGLQKKLDEAAKSPPTPNPGAPSVTELQAQLDETRKQLDSAEHEKAFINERAASVREDRPAVAVKRASVPTFRGTIRGTVLAVNNAYNFVVLNLGNRQGVEANAEMLVLRGGTTIGKIRISSVEPATAIGDILGNSLAHGVQVQPGDIVIYAGTNS